MDALWGWWWWMPWLGAVVLMKEASFANLSKSLCRRMKLSILWIVGSCLHPWWWWWVCSCSVPIWDTYITDEHAETWLMLGPDCVSAQSMWLYLPLPGPLPHALLSSWAALARAPTVVPTAVNPDCCCCCRHQYRWKILAGSVYNPGRLDAMPSNVLDT